jgi:hypothetical protein
MSDLTSSESRPAMIQDLVDWSATPGSDASTLYREIQGARLCLELLANDREQILRCPQLIAAVSHYSYLAEIIAFVCFQTDIGTS